MTYCYTTKLTTDFIFEEKFLTTLAFDDPDWRSPVTGSTASEIMIKRKAFREIVRRVNVVMVERYRIAAEEHRIKLADEAEIARLEQEERDNAQPIKRRSS